MVCKNGFSFPPVLLPLRVVSLCAVWALVRFCAAFSRLALRFHVRISRLGILFFSSFVGIDARTILVLNGRVFSSRSRPCSASGYSFAPKRVTLTIAHGAVVVYFSLSLRNPHPSPGCRRRPA